MIADGEGQPHTDPTSQIGTPHGPSSEECLAAFERWSEPHTDPTPRLGMLEDRGEHGLFRYTPAGWEQVPWIEQRAHELVKERNELRWILEPLLDEPFTFDYECEFGCPHMRCLFCEAAEPNHDSDCPVLHRDRLLGRQP